MVSVNVFLLYRLFCVFMMKLSSKMRMKFLLFTVFFYYEPECVMECM